MQSVEKKVEKLLGVMLVKPLKLRLKLANDLLEAARRNLEEVDTSR